VAGSRAIEKETQLPSRRRILIQSMKEKRRGFGWEHKNNRGESFEKKNVLAQGGS